MKPIRCSWCPGTADPRSTCPMSIKCPTCRVGPGQSCRRPSGHSGAFVDMHTHRIEAAEARDRSAKLDWTLKP